MEDIIRLLPDSVANQIAAGEVVQRPSSIIKEMVENSIDAGATNIQVLVVDGGKSNVQVIDNGKGMSETDARLAFERHATSKIRQASDLYNLSTMGFRGEALASIAAVAQVSLTTRREEDELGTYIEISGSKVEKQEPVACAVGSNFAVKNLFFNVPARRKFMKSNQTELTNVVQDFERIALVYPDIAFSLYNNGVEMYHLPQSTLRQRIVDVFGKKINTELLPIEVETSLVSISGYVGKPESCKKKGAKEFFFVNGRYMRHPYFHSAVIRAFENLIPPGEHISYFIYFAVDPSSIDVNVHPTKTEIKFDNEQPIWQVLSATIKETIGKFCNVPLIDFDVEDKPDIPAFGTVKSATAMYAQPRNVVSSYNPFKESSSDASVRAKKTTNWGKMFQGVTVNDSIDIDLVPSDMNVGPVGNDCGESDGEASSVTSVGGDSSGLHSLDEHGSCFAGTYSSSGNVAFDDGFKDSAEYHSCVDGLVASSSNTDANRNEDGEIIESGGNGELFDDSSSPIIYNGYENGKEIFDSAIPKFQYRGRYIVMPVSQGLMLVDQHRAHVRILYEQNMQSMTLHHRPTQKTLFPEIVQFTINEGTFVEKLMDDITALGFELTNLGGASYSVSGVPGGMEGVDVDTLLHEMVASAIDGTDEVEKTARESMALTMANASAIVYGQVLSAVEMNRLLADLFSLPSSARTPDGKVICSIIDAKSIEKLF